MPGSAAVLRTPFARDGYKYAGERTIDIMRGDGIEGDEIGLEPWPSIDGFTKPTPSTQGVPTSACSAVASMGSSGSW